MPPRAAAIFPMTHRVMPASDAMPTSSNFTCPDNLAPAPLALREQDIEAQFIEQLRGLNYRLRHDIRDRAALERNFRQKFEALNRVSLRVRYISL